MQTPVYTVLVIEDDLPLKMLIAQHLASLNYNVLTARSWKDAQALLELNEPDLIILDIRLPDANGLDLIKGLAGGYAVIVLTAYGSITNAVRAIKEGAFEYLTKPITQEELELNVARAMENLALKRNYVFVRDQQRAARPGVVVGTSEAMNTLMGLVNAVAQSNATVLIHGESGAGKEVIAHEIHERSPRAGRNDVALDCCTLQDNLFESELFGHERGAFTGANALKRGLIEAADGGTLFLDEIGEISPAAQAKLLRVIETKQYRRVGGTKDLAGDVRIVAATNRDLAEMAREGRFRADLVLPAQRLRAEGAAAPPAPRGHTGACEPLHREARLLAPRAQEALARGRARAHRIRLARKRARTEERHGTGDHSLRQRRHDQAAACDAAGRRLVARRGHAVVRARGQA